MTTHPFHQSLIRPNLLLGCDRELFILLTAAASILVVLSQNWTAAVTGILLFIFTLALLQKIAKADPLMRTVYLRHRLYRPYYAPRSTPFRVNTREYREYA